MNKKEEKLMFAFEKTKTLFVVKKEREKVIYGGLTVYFWK